MLVYNSVWLLTSWQLWPLYALLATQWLIPSRFRRTKRTLTAALAIASLGTWTFLPVLTIPAPLGPGKVGTVIYRWVDSSRAEETSPDGRERRNVVAQIFYPTHTKATGPEAPYLDGIGHLPPVVAGMPRFLLSHLDHAHSHAITNAPLAERATPWPVILWSPGYGAPRSFYTGLILEFVARGYAVIAIDHPYEAGVCELADGRIVGNVIRRRPHDPDLTFYMARQQAVRVADMRLVLDQLESSPWRDQLDLKHVAAAGHSFGGAASLAAMAADARIQAGINIDGTPYGDLPQAHLRGPAMLLRSDPANTHAGQAFRSGNRQILSHLADGPGSLITLRGTNHFSWTDLPFFFSPPGRWVVTAASATFRPFGLDAGLSCFACVDPRDLRRLTVDVIAGFLAGREPLARVVAQHQDLVKSEAVSPGP